ncbi:MAG: nitroreductase [Chloroflexi bacterium]|jgi:nitroreductase|nr:nitroreductase [Chloroflexota bacterium]
MEFNEVIGLRRSVRFLNPWKPVERGKIQAMLEAANRASRSVNADYPRALVVKRDDLDDQTRDALRNPTTTSELDLAPVYIFWYFDANYLEGAQERLKELVAQRALPAAHGWSDAYVDDVVYAQVLQPIGTMPEVVTFMGAVEVGIAICNAVNAAVNEGLGTCLHAFTNPEVVKARFHVPDNWVPVWLQLVGYCLEEREAGGQRPRRPLSHSYFEGDCTTPFEDDPETTEHLRRTGMIQAPGPFPYRETEVRMLSRMLGLPE